MSAGHLDDEAHQRWARRCAGGLYLFVVLAGVIANDAPLLTTSSTRLIGLVLDVAAAAALLTGRVPIGLLIGAFVGGSTYDAIAYTHDLQFD